MIHRPAITLLTLIGAVSCTTEYLPEPNTPEAPSVHQAEIGPLVARATCELRESCGQIGPGHDHASVDACAASTAADAADDVDAEDCQDGAWPTRIDACLAQIRMAGCEQDLDPGTLAACNEDFMCWQPRDGGAGQSAAPQDPLRSWD